MSRIWNCEMFQRSYNVDKQKTQATNLLGVMWISLGLWFGDFISYLRISFKVMC